MVIAIEGLPGAGKTTTTRLVSEILAVQAVMETTADHPFLRQVYDDEDRDDLTVELSFLIVHANAYRRLNRGGLSVCDFSPVKDELFAEDMLRDEELGLFQDVYSGMYRDHHRPDIAVYLRVAPRVCLERVTRRMSEDPARAFEAGLDIERLERMQARYESGLERLGQRTVAVDLDPEMSREFVADAVAARIQTLSSSDS